MQSVNTIYKEKKKKKRSGKLQEKCEKKRSGKLQEKCEKRKSWKTVYLEKST